MQLSWQDEIRKSFRDAYSLGKFLGQDFKEVENYPVFVPQIIAKKIKEQGHEGPLYKQFVACQSEVDPKLQKMGLKDPIGDEVHSKGSGIIHRYNNRVLFTPTTVCPINCRYCFRKNELGHSDVFHSSLNALIDYLKSNSNVEEVILTGGDPLILSDDKLAKIYTVLAEINTVKYLRIHTRFPVIVPSRITPRLIQILTNKNNTFKTIIAIHCNHTSEFDNQIESAIKLLSKSGISLLSQTVLLKDVNDDVNQLVKLMKKFDDVGIRPYYLHHPDKVEGAMHFHLSLEDGRRLYAKLRNYLPGWLLPHYVIDGPLGKGKSLAFNPESFKFSGNLIDKDGLIYQS